MPDPAEPQSGTGGTHSIILQCSALLRLQGKRQPLLRAPTSPQSLWDRQLAAGTRSVAARGHLDLGAVGHSSPISTQAEANADIPQQLPMAMCVLKAGIYHPSRAAVGAQSPQGSISTSITPGQVGQERGNLSELAVSTGQLGREGGCTRGWFFGCTLVSSLTFSRDNFTDKPGSRSTWSPH